MDENSKTVFTPADWEGAKCPNCQEGQVYHEWEETYPNPEAGCDIPQGEPITEKREAWEQCGNCEGTGKVPYDLAGFAWKPDESPYGLENDNLVIIQTYENALYRGNPREATKDWYTRNLPLLPSPERINAQDNHREVAIAALERAGFESFSGYTICVCKGCYIYIYPNSLPPEIIFNTSDPTLAQYALDCFKVLKAWADAVDWGK